MNHLLDLRCVCALIFFISCASFAPAQDAKSPSDKQASEDGDKSAEKEPNDKVELKGVFEATESSHLMLRPKEWTTLIVDEAIEHGAEVDKGDVLLRLDTDKIDDAIQDAEAELETEKLTLENAEIKFDLLRRSSEMSLAEVEKAERLASEDLKDFITTGRDRRVNSAKRSVQSARNNLAYQSEELRQLEKMYQADDLTEETEEIILKRTRDAVERAEYSLGSIIDSERRSLAFTIPRSEDELKTSLKRTALALEEARRTAPNNLKQKALAFEKQQRDFEKKQEKLERMRADRKLLEVRAPQDGVVYYGSSKRGKWSDSGTMAAMLQPGGTVKAKIVLMTVVELEPLTVRVSVPESSLRFVRPGISAQISSVAFPDETLSGTVKRVSSIPVSDGVFDAVMTFDLGDLKGRIVPGMKAEITIKKDESADDNE